MEEKKRPRRPPPRKMERVSGDPNGKALAAAKAAPKRAAAGTRSRAPSPSRRRAATVSTLPDPGDAPPAAPTVASETARPAWSEESFVIPPAYGDTRISLLVKDPWWTYAYWEVADDVRKDMEKRLPQGEGWRAALRVYDVTETPVGSSGTGRSFDVLVPGFLGTWFLHTDGPSRSFVVDIGFLSRGGQFIPLARSNRITSPRLGPSEVVDEEWMSSEETYWRLFGATAGVGIGSSPMEVRRVLERKLSSGAVASPAAPFSEIASQARAEKERAFFLRVWTELIVHGATDPRASVTLQGQPVRLRPDGTFTCRFALPDGTQVIPVEAVSPDRLETRRITPTVTQGTTEEAGS